MISLSRVSVLDDYEKLTIYVSLYEGATEDKVSYGGELEMILSGAKISLLLNGTNK